jgi:hypothetical protein
MDAMQMQDKFKIEICYQPIEGNYLARVPGLDHIEERGASMFEAMQKANQKIIQYLESMEYVREKQIY